MTVSYENGRIIFDDFVSSIKNDEITLQELINNQVILKEELIWTDGIANNVYYSPDECRKNYKSLEGKILTHDHLEIGDGLSSPQTLCVCGWFENPILKEVENKDHETETYADVVINSPHTIAVLYTLVKLEWKFGYSPVFIGEVDYEGQKAIFDSTYVGGSFVFQPANRNTYVNDSHYESRGEYKINTSKKLTSELNNLCNTHGICLNKILPNDLDEDKEKQKRRAKACGIPVKEQGHITKPSKYKDVPDTQTVWGDWTNYKYPIDNETHIRAAVRYYNQSKNQKAGGYNDSEWAKIGKNIIRQAKSKLKIKYQIKDKKIVKMESANRDFEFESLKTTVANLSENVDGILNHFEEEKELKRKAEAEKVQNEIEALRTENTELKEQIENLKTENKALKESIENTEEPDLDDVGLKETKENIVDHLVENYGLKNRKNVEEILADSNEATVTTVVKILDTMAKRTNKTIKNKKLPEKTQEATLPEGKKTLVNNISDMVNNLYKK